jgi:actin-related protein 8
MSADLNEDIFDNNYKWISISGEPHYLVGREAVTIAETEKYLLRYPIKYGLFNTEYSHQGVIDDLTKITEFCLYQVLGIQKKDYQNFNVVVLLPDLFVKPQVKAFINIFLRNLGFRSAFVHLESIMATFGTALQSACVVDIGADKINVCCVDEGMIIDDTLIRKNLGGNDLTKLLFHMLTRTGAKSYFPSHLFDINNAYHFRIFEKLKENECEFPNLQNPSVQLTAKNVKLWLHKKNSSTKILNVTINEPLYYTPLGLFYKEIFETIKTIHIPNLDFFNDIYEEQYIDSEDTMTDLIRSLISANEVKKDDEKGKNSVIKIKDFNNPDEESLSQSPSRSEENSSNIYDGELFKSKIYIIFRFKEKQLRKYVPANEHRRYNLPVNNEH